ncbi:hypothetical protein GCM10027285_26870 [Oleiagrimonas citrea]|uniref:Uncharacterized protein n=1 Tax=Oleiagrimonas citrea TaxID=1665687 RepID=A0A846ZMW2_9GAMM|nr:hypothetical protein [Oleiagrimonas citrea]NKZ39027.1 hypothetical protein [Oleiagrimonas citrea]
MHASIMKHALELSRDHGGEQRANTHPVRDREDTQDFRDHLQARHGQADASRGERMHESPSSSTPEANMITAHDVLAREFAGTASVPLRDMRSGPSLPGAARVYLQHWYANGYLSVIPVAERPAAAVQPPAAKPQQVSSVFMQPRSGAVRFAMSDSAPPVSASEISFTGMAVSLQRQDGLEQGEEGRVVRSVVRDFSAVVSWPERMLWHSRSRDGGWTLWVRDYRLQDTERNTFVAQYRSLSEQLGATPERVMVNGRQAWSRSGSGSLSQ